MALTQEERDLVSRLKQQGKSNDEIERIIGMSRVESSHPSVMVAKSNSGEPFSQTSESGGWLGETLGDIKDTALSMYNTVKEGQATTAERTKRAIEASGGTYTEPTGDSKLVGKAGKSFLQSWTPEAKSAQVDNTWDALGTSARVIGEGALGVGKLFLSQGQEDMFGNAFQAAVEPIVNIPSVRKGIEDYQWLKENDREAYLQQNANLKMIDALLTFAPMLSAGMKSAASSAARDALVETAGKRVYDAATGTWTSGTTPALIGNTPSAAGAAATGAAEGVAGEAARMGFGEAALRSTRETVERALTNISTAAEQARARQEAIFNAPTPEVGEAIATGVSNREITNIVNATEPERLLNRDMLYLYEGENREAVAQLISDLGGTKYNKIDTHLKQVGNELGQAIDDLKSKGVTLNNKPAQQQLVATLAENGVEVSVSRGGKVQFKYTAETPFTDAQKPYIEQAVKRIMQDSTLTPTAIYQTDRFMGNLTSEMFGAPNVSMPYISIQGKDQPLMKVLRDIYRSPLDLITDGNISALNREYSFYKGFIDDLEATLFNEGKALNIPMDVGAPLQTNIRRVFSNAQSRAKFSRVLQELDARARMLGDESASLSQIGEFDMFLQKLYPEQAIQPGSFAGQIRATGLGEMLDRMINLGKPTQEAKQKAVKALLNAERQTTQPQKQASQAGETAAQDIAKRQDVSSDTSVSQETPKDITDTKTDTTPNAEGGFVDFVQIFKDLFMGGGKKESLERDFLKEKTRIIENNTKQMEKIADKEATLERRKAKGKVSLRSYEALKDSYSEEYASLVQSNRNAAKDAKELVMKKFLGKQRGGLGEPDDQWLLTNAKKALKEDPENTVLQDYIKTLEERTKGQGVLSKNDKVQLKSQLGTPDVALRTNREVPMRDVAGQKFTVPANTAMTPRIDGGKVYLDVNGKTYTVPKNQYENLKGQSTRAVATPFAPELEGTNKVTSPVGTSIGSSDFTQYTLPGGENYTEIIRTAPVENSSVTELISEAQTIAKRNGYELNASKLTETNSYGQTELDEIGDALYGTPDGNRFAELNDAIVNSKGESMESGVYRSSHWRDTPNPIYHVRLNDRTWNKNKVTFMEELQSDWAREAKEKGFSYEGDVEDLLPKGWTVKSNGTNYVVRNEKGTGVQNKFNPTNDVIKEGSGGHAWASSKRQAVAMALGRKDLLSSIPPNPLLKNWQVPAVKDALMEAVDRKSKIFAWINGDQTSARYNLATYVDDVTWSSPERSPFKRVQINAKQGKSWDVNVEDDGTIAEGGAVPGDWIGKKLDEALGKGLADKIMSADKGTLSGEGLKFGGEWANNLYDKQVRDIVKKLTGAEVKKADMGLGTGKDRYFTQPNNNKKIVSSKQVKIGEEILSGGDGKKNSFYVVDKNEDGTIYVIESRHPELEVQNDERLYKKYLLPNADATNAIQLAVSDAIKAGEFDKDTYVEAIHLGIPIQTQQYIELTPEVVAKIKGKAPKIEVPEIVTRALPLVLLYLVANDQQ